MRWELIKKSWNLAKNHFPDANRLYVHVPKRLGCKGRCKVVDLDVPDKPLGSITYSASVGSSRPIIRLEMNGDSDRILLSRSLSKYRVKSETRRITKLSSINPSLMASKSKDAFDLGYNLALLLATEKKNVVSRVTSASWLGENGFPPEMMTPLREGLERIGCPMTDDGGYNRRMAKREPKYEIGQKVRVVYSTSNEYQECGRITELKGGGKDPVWYSVQVDGSEGLLWFPESSLEPNEAGEVKKR